MNIRAIEKKINESAIKLLEEKIKEVRSGSVVAVTILSEYDNSEYNFSMSTSSSRTQTAGMLLDAAIKRLGYGYED